MSEQQIQESQYVFPYHYLPSKDDSGSISRVRGVKWGYEYLAYSEYIVSKIMSYRPKKVLEVGCGDGYIANKVSSTGIDVTGVDISVRAIGFARAFSTGARFSRELKAQAPHEMVILIEVLEHIPDQELALFVEDLWSRVLPGGHLVVSVPSKVVQVHKKHFRHYDIQMIKETFADAIGADLQSVEYIYREPAWFTWFLRLTFNKYFIFEPIFLSKWIWKFIMKTMLIANENDGRHLVCVYKRLV